MTKTANFPVTVSAITPARNAADVLTRAVHSVEAQTFTDWEMIIVDDGSSDTTAALARTLARKEPRLRVLCHATGMGAAKARNTAIKAARGRYIAFLDADDAWLPDKLAKQLQRMHDQKAGLSYTGFLRLSGTKQRSVQIPERVTRAELLLGNCIGCSTSIYDRAMLGTVLMPDLPMRQDYALWLTLLEQLPYAVGIDAPLARLYTTPGSLSSNKWRAMRATWAMHHGHFQSGPLRSAFYVASHTLRRLRRG